jgi:hypothetical protein
MIIAPPPLHVMEQMLIRLGQGPGAPGEQRHSLAYGEINSFNKCRLDQTSETMGFQQVIEVAALAPQHARNRIFDLTILTSLD